MEILNKIEKLIKQKGINKKIFLEDMGMNKSRWGAWVRGDSKTYYDNIPKIARYFNVSADYLLGLNDKLTPSGNLSDKEKYLLKMFNTLNETDQGIIIGRLEVMTENSKLSNRKKS